MRDPCFWTFCYNNTNGANHYCPTLQKKCTKIKNKCRGKVTDGIVLLHDTAYPHCDPQNAGPTKCHAYSGELLPCDFPILGSLQIALIDHTLTFDGHVQEAAGQWFRQQTKEFFAVMTCQIVL